MASPAASVVVRPARADDMRAVGRLGAAFED
jgi:hypothetical protein